ncbi:red chlorophyll catabolite reductase, chloroplastic isoform X2 [Cynara cardunculus var. scolymus]|uniref:red chlorophyll catabolite reductase, chloroplastic isoform X2 n=1 Tax=Cynara cardunculus var. scolymus TaxID=59895 RepID=UPI000D63136E|nr:red chlorophyll catabolite reductase, chloroplastic isoform X2 [Cynara cardunculus var. scolymus]
MAAIAFHFSPPSFCYSSPSLQNSSYSSLSRLRFSCSVSSSVPQHGGRTGFMEFPYVSAPHKDLMVDLVSTVETRLESFLNPCNLPPDVQSCQNSTGTAHASIHLRSGVQSSIDFILGSWLHCELPSGGALNITSLSAYLNSSTDAPNLLVELIQSSPTSMVLILDLPPRKDLVLNPDYLKTFYEDTHLDQHRQHLEKLSEVRPYFSSSLYIRSVASPTAILVLIETERLEEMIKTHVSPIAKEVLKTWLDICVFGERRVDETEKAYLKKRDEMSKSKTIEIDLGSNLPRLFGHETANRVLEALREVF